MIASDYSPSICHGLSLLPDCVRTVLAVKGSLRRAYRRALDREDRSEALPWEEGKTVIGKTGVNLTELGPNIVTRYSVGRYQW